MTDGADDESKSERINRELIELLNELRVALPGVQVLFAFLLAVPFTPQFDSVTAFQRDVYFVTLALAAVSSVFLIAPSSQHRWLFRKDDKEQLLFRSNRYAVVGLMLLGLALCSAILLIADYLFSRTAAVVYTCLLAGPLLYLWLVLPLVKRDRRSGRATSE